jgi:hypothetical protein
MAKKRQACFSSPIENLKQERNNLCNYEQSKEEKV